MKVCGPALASASQGLPVQVRKANSVPGILFRAACSKVLTNLLYLELTLDMGLMFTKPGSLGPPKCPCLLTHLEGQVSSRSKLHLTISGPALSSSE
ncbi:hypothetical protein PoB_005246400 [Plakobranchus ocellatus]|uniref:Uncharacterized protein n=1 Tax=Plakobranchus ocellatus TaxID=259542 RepID=A0AAV4C4A7_9GAST|nr:hypothetical protein PoB_005246400 [Plakobranchus ocellatus]